MLFQLDRQPVANVAAAHSTAVVKAVEIGHAVGTEPPRFGSKRSNGSTRIVMRGQPESRAPGAGPQALDHRIPIERELARVENANRARFRRICGYGYKSKTDQRREFLHHVQHADGLYVPIIAARFPVQARWPRRKV